ncbi:hypothetical protein AA0312_1269 [Acetobacter tropicalis NRIC 0312]|nr:hypothetical protein ATR1_452d0037 [Acetobacter tropicalis]GBR69160.1 hypothetical protein AA0312_1269 [Acetobacter tropicalis NRIC 0312]
MLQLLRPLLLPQQIPPQPRQLRLLKPLLRLLLPIAQHLQRPRRTPLRRLLARPHRLLMHLQPLQLILPLHRLLPPARKKQILTVWALCGPTVTSLPVAFC